MVSFDKYITKFILLYLFSLNYIFKLQRSLFTCSLCMLGGFRWPPLRSSVFYKNGKGVAIETPFTFCVKMYAA